MCDAKQSIMEILEKEEFLSVKELAERVFISESSVRRHLTALQNSGYVQRSHGGASLTERVDRLAPLNNRMKKNTVQKRLIAKKAASLLSDNMCVMLDGSSTSSFIVPYLARHKSITLYVNNMETALKAIALGIKTHCLGGSSQNGSPELTGVEAYEQASKIFPDILFFSSQNIDDSGTISDSLVEPNYLRTIMLKNAKTTVFLCDSTKFHSRSFHMLTHLDNIDYAVFDTESPFVSASCKIL